MQVEKLAKKIQEECEKDGEPVTWDEALEMAEMEIKSKSCRRYEQKEKPKEQEKKEKKRHTVKISDEKKELFQTILANLDRADGVSKENITILRENKLIQVVIGEKIFKIDLIETRQKKKIEKTIEMHEKSQEIPVFNRFA